MAGVAATIYALISIISARIANPVKDIGSTLFRIVLTWIIFAPVSLLVDSPPIQLFFAFIWLASLKPKDKNEAIVFYLGTMTAMPGFISYEIPFPGLNYLFELTYWKVASLTILLPIFIEILKSPDKTKFGKTDKTIIIYLFYISIMSIREFPFTSMLRFSFDQFLLLALPYVVISRTLTQITDLEKSFKTLLFVAVTLAAIGLVSTLKTWDFYQLHGEETVIGIPEFRNGFLRIGLTINTGSLSMVMVFGILAINLYRKRLSINLIYSWAYRAIFALIIFATGNRGALLLCILAFAISYFLKYTDKGLRRFTIFLVLVSAVVLALYTPSIDVDEHDSYNTFSYRVEVFDATVKQVAEYPLFGKMHYLETGNFDHLVQGQGIIDIVNWYAQISLEYGLIGLVLFLLAYVRVISKIYKSYCKLNKDDPKRNIAIYILSILFPYLIFIGTTSNVSMVPLLGIIALSFGQALINIINNPQKNAEHPK